MSKLLLSLSFVFTLTLSAFAQDGEEDYDMRFEGIFVAESEQAPTGEFEAAWWSLSPYEESLFCLFGRDDADQDITNIEEWNNRKGDPAAMYCTSAYMTYKDGVAKGKVNFSTIGMDEGMVIEFKYTFEDDGKTLIVETGGKKYRYIKVQ